jgi:arylsulfatase A-like enzyme
MKKIGLIFIIFITAALAGLLLFKGAEIRYIFLITLDTTRADAIDYSLKGNLQTPNLARLAAEGVRFNQAYSQIPITLPAHFVIFHSLPPHVLKVYNNGQTVEVAQPALSRLLKSHGYRTAAVVSLGVLKAEFGLARGFDRYGEQFNPDMWHRSAEEVNRQAFGLIRGTLRGRKNQNAFFWLHYSDPHTPYSPPYYSGTLSVLLEGQERAAYAATQEPVAKLKLPLKPGPNEVSLRVDVPHQWRQDPKLAVKYFEYHDFRLEAPGHLKDVDIRLPQEWRMQRVRGKTIYRTNAPSETILLVNNRPETLTVEIDFIFKVMVGKAGQRALYRESVAYMDRHLGHLIDFLKENDMYRRSVFIVVGDHGEGLGEHKHYFGHIHYLNKIYSHVPLIVAGAGLKQRGVSDQVVSLLDIAPTILDIAGVEIPGFMTGQSLLKPGDNRKLLLETYVPEAYYDACSLLDFPYQIIYTPGRKDKKERVELIHLPTDHWGIRSIFAAAATDGKVKSSLLKEVLKISRRLSGARGKTGPVPERHRDMLKSLGYL